MDNEKIKIDNFTGFGENGHYFLKGFAPAKINGQSILSMEHDTDLFKSSTDYSTISSIKAATMTDDEDTDQLIFYGGGKIHEFNTISANNVGLIHQIGETGSTTDQILSLTGGDILTSVNGNFLYTSMNHLGVGYKGTATGGTATTLVDTTVDFTALEDVTDGSTSTLKVVNVTQKEIFTVTGVAATTLTFSAGSTTPASGDYYYFFVDGKYKFDTFSGKDNQFNGQLSTSNWTRRIILWEDKYYINNGNYIATLDLDETTFSATTQQLPSRSTMVTMETNGSYFLIATEVDGRGELILWDGELKGFLNRIKLPQPIQCMTPYKNGWLYIMGPHLYFTNGWTLQKMTRLPDLRDDRDINDIQLNGIKELYGNIYIAVSSGNTSRLKNGVLVLDPENGFTYVPTQNDTGDFMAGRVTGIFSFQTNGMNTTLVASTDTGQNPSITTLSYLRTSPPDNAMAVFFRELNDNQPITTVELNVGAHHLSNSNGSTTITVRVGDNKSHFFSFGYTDTGTTATSLINLNGAINSASVGDEIWMLEGQTSNERTTVTAVANQGTSTETITVSPALSSAPYDGTSAQFNILKVRKSISITFNNQSIPEDLLFPLNGFFSDNVFIEVLVEGAPIDIHSIKLV